ncbi:MFS transporter [Kocuria rosea subsp. polaris]|uniref:MFS transporter n=1 Tax=Kocuria rosea subsp. polaris TaxID=136273 RepID=A0A0W8I3B6_KOCRO|nr:MFS transporter [Kocuria polaris]KUG52175.1 MFS transporter [Kocuria polaris]
MLSPAPDAPARAGAREWAALVVLMLPVLLISVDNTVLNFALPEISRQLRPTGAQLLWMVDAYPLVLAGLLVPMGALGDRVGRRRLLLVGSTGFAAVSAVAAFAPSGEVLVAARAALGLFGSMLMPATLSLLRNMFHDATQRRTAIAVWATGFSAGGVLGPVVGGFLLQHLWWGSVFLLAVPVLLPLLVLAPVLVPESRNPAPGPVDVPSAALIVVAMVALVHGIKDLGAHGPSAGVLAAAVAAAAAGALFVRRQLRSPVPMLDLRLFRHAPFAGGLLNNLVASTTFIGFLFFVSQHLQLVEGMPPLQAGLALLPGAAVTIASGLLVVHVVGFVPPALVLGGGLLVMASGFLLVLLGDLSGGLVLVVALVVVGLGSGAAQTIAGDLVLTEVPLEQAGAASAISETAYELGAALGVAVLGTAVTATYARRTVLPPGLDPEQAATASETLGGAVVVAAALGPDASGELLASAVAAFEAGVHLSAGIGAALLAATAVAVGVLLRRVPRLRRR